MPAKLIIEVDGAQHAEHADYDDARRQFIEDQGFIVLRFTNEDVRSRLDWVMQEIGRTLDLARGMEAASLSPDCELAPLTPLGLRPVGLSLWERATVQSSTVLSSDPMPSMTIDTVLTFSFITPTPTEVPQAMRSPGFRVMSCDSAETSLATGKIMSEIG